VLIAVHSFTPVFKGVSRPWQIGVLYNRDTRFADIMLDLLRREGDLTVGDNEPYAVGDLTDYTIPVHGEQRGIPHVELEIRQDLIGDAAGQTAWADRLARILAEAYRRLAPPDART
jgi:predicted N-formylglutamate amidohydrolase